MANNKKYVPPSKRFRRGAGDRGSYFDYWLGGGRWKPRPRVQGAIRDRTPIVNPSVTPRQQTTPSISPLPAPINPIAATPANIRDSGATLVPNNVSPFKLGTLPPFGTTEEIGEVKEKGLLDRAGDFISRKWEGRDKTPMDSPVNRGLIQFGLSAMNPDTYYNKEGFGIGALGAFSKAGQAGLAEHDKITKMLAKREDRRFDRDMRNRLYDLEVDKGDRAQQELGFREQEIDLLGDRFDLDQKNIKGLIKTRAGQIKLQERIFAHNKWKDREANEQMSLGETGMSFTKAQWAKIIPTIVTSETSLDSMTMYMLSQMAPQQKAIFMKELRQSDPLAKMTAIFKQLKSEKKKRWKKKKPTSRSDGYHPTDGTEDPLSTKETKKIIRDILDPQNANKLERILKSRNQNG